MLSELAAIGKYIDKDEQNERNKKNLTEEAVIFVNLSYNEKSGKIEYRGVSDKDIKENDIDNIPIPLEKLHSNGIWDYPVGSYTAKALDNRIINWFERKHKEVELKTLSDVKKVIENNRDDIQNKVKQKYKELKKDKKIFLTIKINDKFPKEVDFIKSAAENKSKTIEGRDEEWSSGLCRICNRDKQNIIKGYKKISKIIGFFTLDKAGFASYFNKNDVSSNLSICEDCLQNISKAYNALFDKIKLGGGIYLAVIPTISSLSDDPDAEKDAKNIVDKYIEQIEKTSEDKNYLFNEKSPDNIIDTKQIYLRNKYIFYKKNQNSKLIYKEIIADPKLISDFIERDKKIFNIYGVSYTQYRGLINSIVSVLSPDKEIKNKLDYSSEDLPILFSIDLITSYIVNTKDSKEFSDMIQQFYRYCAKVFRVHIIESLSINRDKIKSNSLYNLGVKVLYLLDLFDLYNNMENNSENMQDGTDQRLGKIMSYLKRIPEDKRLYALIGLEAIGLHKFQYEEKHVSGTVIESFYNIKKKEDILSLWSKLQEKIREYWNELSSDYYKDYNKNFSKLSREIGELATLKYNNDNKISNEEAILLFEIGVSLSNYWYHGDNTEKS